jgi:hypothetical protein
VNDAELDALATRAAAQTRAKAGAVADSEVALQQLLADAAAEIPAPRDPVVPYHGPIRDPERRHRWQLVAVAAVVGVFALGIGYAITNGSSTIEIAGPPAGGTGIGAGPTPPTPADPPASRVSPPPTPTETSAPVSTVAPNDPATTSPVDSHGTTDSVAPVDRPADPTAGFFIPELVPFALDDLPYLLPDPPPAADRALRGEEVWEVPVPLLSQLWVRTGAAGTVDAMVQVTTQSPPAAVGQRAVDVAGWDSAGVTDMPDGYAQVTLGTDEISVTVWAEGLTVDDVLAIARALRADGSSWRAAPLDAEGWAPIQEMWSTGAATRWTTVVDADGDVDLELGVGRGTDVFLYAGVLQSGADLRVVDVDGQPGILGRAGVSGLVVVRDDGVMVVVNSRDPDADLVSLAGSLTRHDRAGWEAATSPWPEGLDGCVGLFC